MTSEELEDSVRAVVPCPLGGRLITAGFPGLMAGIDGTAYIDPDAMAATMARIQKEGAKVLIVLTEEDELPDGAFAELHQHASGLGVDIRHMPIPDYHSPDATTLASWQEFNRTNPAAPGVGGTVAFCCHYGAGRSGTMAAYVLMQQGMTKDSAILTIREAFPESIESEVQLAFLEKISARLKDGAADLDPV